MLGVCPRAYTWPNDPQTYNCDAKQYVIVFSPGGTKLPVAGPRAIPKCSSLPPAAFDYAGSEKNCAQAKGTFGCAKTKASGHLWDCDVDATGCNGVLCRW
jgi:hypothetical protein